MKTFSEQVRDINDQLSKVRRDMDALCKYHLDLLVKSELENQRLRKENEVLMELSTAQTPPVPSDN